MMMFSSLQGAMAFALDHVETGAGCEETVVMQTVEGCSPHQVSDNHQGHECPSPCNMTSLHASAFFKPLMPTSINTKHGLVRDYADFPGYLPDLLKRPPKA